jgi:hypothetical protein
MREHADGKDLGLAKIVAGLTGLGADDIYRRAERQRRQRRFFGGLIVALWFSRWPGWQLGHS